MKKSLKPGTILSPLPAVMVSCGDEEEKNIITIGWTGIVNSEPPMTYVSVRESRHSHKLISKTGEFVINLTTEDLAYATDWCGVKSGRDVDKFAEMNLTPVKGDHVSCPMIKESPVNLECKVTEIHKYPSHDMFVAEIVGLHVDESIMDEKGKIMLENAGLLSYCHGNYYGIKKETIGRFGFSVMKDKTKKKIRREEHKQRIEKNRRRRNAIKAIMNADKQEEKSSDTKEHGGNRPNRRSSEKKFAAKKTTNRSRT